MRLWVCYQMKTDLTACLCRLKVGAQLAAPTRISQYKGLNWHKARDKWEVKISIQRRCYVYLGNFADELDAAAAYDKAAVILRGKEATLNLPLSNYLDADGNVIVDQAIKEKMDRKG